MPGAGALGEVWAIAVAGADSENRTRIKQVEHRIARHSPFIVYGTGVVVVGSPEHIMQMMSQTLSASLADISLPDTSGREVRLGSLWHEGPAVLVFLRHYG